MVNVVVLHGRLSRPPERRWLPSGDELVNLEVTVERAEGPAESVPVVWFGAPPSVDELDVGAQVAVAGRVRRRFFRAGGSTQSRTEVVADGVVPVRQAARARRLVAGAAAAVDDGLAALPAPPRRARARPAAGQAVEAS